MDSMDFRVAGGAGIILVGVLTTVGAFVMAFGVAGVIRTGGAIAMWMTGVRARPCDGTVDGRRGVERNGRLAGAADHALHAREAWWLRC